MPTATTFQVSRFPTSTTKQRDHLKMGQSEESIDDIYALMDRQGKMIPAIPAPSFIGTLLVGVPLWATVLLPLSLVSQVGLALVKPLLPKPEFDIDTRATVDASEIVPRQDRKYDVVVLGATGFTGKLVVEYLCRTYGGKTHASM